MVGPIPARVAYVSNVYNCIQAYICSLYTYIYTHVCMVANSKRMRTRTLVLLDNR